jgi:predicted metal-dependent hydrolase
MKKLIIIKSQEINYELRWNKRAKRLRISVYPDLSIIVTMPCQANETIAENFIREKSAWLLDKIFKFRKNGIVLTVKSTKADYLKNKTAAEKFIEERVLKLNGLYGFRYKRITVKNQKTRWGSCSRKGNLNFNFRLLFLPLQVADYVIVHELCHLREFNHSNRFWKLVEKAVPDYLAVRRELREGAILAA